MQQEILANVQQRRAPHNPGRRNGGDATHPSNSTHGLLRPESTSPQPLPPIPRSPKHQRSLSNSNMSGATGAARPPLVQRAESIESEQRHDRESAKQLLARINMQCVKDKEKFVDPAFPPTAQSIGSGGGAAMDTSVGVYQANRATQWSRPEQIGQREMGADIMSMLGIFMPQAIKRRKDSWVLWDQPGP